MDKETSEISKLTERISKDPRSKLFVPLAEEYKKAGDMEMSIHVLTEGLKNNPGYVTARSFLGRLLIEKGDLPGARKEFEEVVKAIPDNLMAQRKLGDIHALQNRPADALKYYRTVLKLNPKDSETAALIAEAEAGRDIGQRIAGPKTVETPDLSKTSGVRHQATVQPALKVPSQPAPAGAKQTRPVPPSVMAAQEEEAEEVTMVEPLDPVELTAAFSGLDQDLVKDNLDFLVEKSQEVLPEGPENAVDPFAMADPFAVEEPFHHAAMQHQDKPGQKETEEPDKHADDFTTDTLAELYIAQGFFEKAVEIYERMLVDKPNSQGLKDKLTKVRAMAASAGQGQDEAPAREVIFDDESGLDVVQDDTLGLDGFVPPGVDPGKYPGTGDWELTDVNTVPADQDSGLADQAEIPARQFDVSFEPAEYVPPDAARIPQGPEDEDSGYATELKRPEPPKPGANREETVERLEGWLKNIMKEK